MGPMGPMGPSGQDGRDGVGNPVIIPYASGGVMEFTVPSTEVDESNTWAIGFGNSALVRLNIDGSITLISPPQMPDTDFTMPFSLPRGGVIKSIVAYFRITAIAPAPAPGTELTVSARLFSSTTPNEVFNEIAVATLPTITDPQAGSITDVLLDGLNIPITARTRLLLVLSITSTNSADQLTVEGRASAGVSIE